MENVNAVKIVFEDGYENIIRNYRPVAGTKNVTIYGIEAYYDTKNNKVFKCKVGYLYKHYVYKNSKVLGRGYIDPADSRPAESEGRTWYVVGKKGGGGTNIHAARFNTPGVYAAYTGSIAQVGEHSGDVKKIEVVEK